MAENMTKEKIQLKHPEGKRAVSIDKEKYEIIRKSIISSLKSKELTFTLLSLAIKKKLSGRFEGSINWYVESVKLDLEARNIIERIHATKPQLYRLKIAI